MSSSSSVFRCPRDDDGTGSLSRSTSVFPCLRDDDVGSREKNCDGGNDREYSKSDEAESVKHHGSELPVVLDGSRVLVVPDLVRDHPDLLQDQTELPVDPGGKRTRAAAARGTAVKLRASRGGRETCSR